MNFDEIMSLSEEDILTLFEEAGFSHDSMAEYKCPSGKPWNMVDEGGRVIGYCPYSRFTFSYNTVEGTSGGWQTLYDPRTDWTTYYGSYAAAWARFQGHTTYSGHYFSGTFICQRVYTKAAHHLHSDDGRFCGTETVVAYCCGR